jgi:recombination protein RecA
MAFKVNPKAFDSTIDEFNKKFDHFSVDVDSNDLSIKKRIMLSSPRLNYWFGGGGIRYNAIHQIYGPEHAGKTSLVCAIVGDMQREVEKIIPGKNKVVWLDFERTFDPFYAQTLGLNTDKDHFKLIQANCGEDAFSAVFDLITSGAVVAVVLDSDASMPTRSELEEEKIGKATFGAQAKLLATVIRRINILCANYDTCYYEISQERVDPTAWSPTGIPVKKATGGDTIKFYSSTRGRIQKIEQVTDSEGNGIGIKVKFTNIKNKQGLGSIPWRKIEMTLIFKKGFDPENEYIDMMIDMVEDMPSLEHPSRVMYNSKKYGFECRGRDAFVDWLKAHPKEFEELKHEVDDVMKKQVSLDSRNVAVDENDDGIPSIEIPEDEKTTENTTTASTTTEEK